MAVMRSTDGPLGPGLPRRRRDVKSRRYLPSTRARCSQKSVAGLITAASFGSRGALMKRVVNPRTKRSNVVKFGARFLDRPAMMSWCLSSKDSAATARMPPARASLANVTTK